MLPAGSTPLPSYRIFFKRNKTLGAFSCKSPPFYGMMDEESNRRFSCPPAGGQGKEESEGWHWQKGLYWL